MYVVLVYTFWNKFLSSAQGVILLTKIIRMIVWKKNLKKLVFGAGLSIIKLVFLKLLGGPK